MKYVFIGDIHGCLDELKELVQLARVTSEDRVVCLGDFMDKGPDQAGCVRFARENGFLSVMGNHETKHIRWRQHERKVKINPQYKNPMTPLPEDKLAHNSALSEEDVAWLERLPISLEVFPGVVAVHGGLFPSLPLADQEADKIQRLRYFGPDMKPVRANYDNPNRDEVLPPGSRHWTEVYDGPYDVVYGHEAHSKTKIRQDTTLSGSVCYGIDTGCVHGGRLTALVMTPDFTKPKKYEVSIVQVQSKALYKKPVWEIPA